MIVCIGKLWGDEGKPRVVARVHRAKLPKRFGNVTPWIGGCDLNVLEID